MDGSKIGVEKGHRELTPFWSTRSTPTKSPTGSSLDDLRHTQRPEVLTLNGTAELVVQNATAYQTMLDRLDELETLATSSQAPVGSVFHPSSLSDLT